MAGMGMREVPNMVVLVQVSVCGVEGAEEGWMLCGGEGCGLLSVPIRQEGRISGPLIGWNQTEWENSLNKAH
jgi:hypothetical protein